MSTKREQLLAEMQKVIMDQLDAAPAAVTENARFVEDLGADSLAIVELVLAMEERFRVTIPDTEADKLTTVGDALDFILANGGAPRGENAA